MIILRPAAERGYADHGWLEARHSFSFADYHDPAHMGWGVLRVINEDRVAPGTGFGTHGHRDMEIITWIISGELAHRDSLGNGDVIHRGEAQRMSAGSGVRHSEMNPSLDTPVHLLQIWIEPARKGGEASWEQRAFPVDARQGEFLLLASPDGREGSTRIAQDACVSVAVLPTGKHLAHRFLPERLGWVQLVSGQLELNGQNLAPGDGAAIADLAQLEFLAIETAEFLLFDLPPAH